jgi:competence protein ComEC
MSLGRHNRFNFPRPEVLRRYAARGIRVLRTDQAGAITVVIDRQGGLAATCARGCR